MGKVPVQEGLPPLPRARRKLLARLATRTGRERERLYVLEGRRAIEDALDRGERLRFVAAAPNAEAILREWIAGGRLPEGVEPFGISGAEIERASDTRTPQGLLAVGEVPDLAQAPSAMLMIVGGYLVLSWISGTQIAHWIGDGQSVRERARGAQDAETRR